MQKLPLFPIKCKTEEGETFTAQFKHVGKPNEVKIIIRPSRSQLSLQIYAPLPKTEVLSWGTLAIKAYKSYQQGDPNGNDKNTPMRKPEASEGSVGASDTSNKNRVLSKVRSNPVQANAGLPSEDDLPVVLVKDALQNQTYKTIQSKDPKKHYLCRYQGRIRDKFQLHVYFPPPNSEWTVVEVGADYKLTPYNKEENSMPTKSKAKPAAPVNAPQAKGEKGLTVYEAWGKAFEAHATKMDAPEQIVKFMETQFPGRKTKWAKWVNAVRARYNKGKLPGVKAPTEKIAVYGFKKAPARKPERRTPPLKSVRKKVEPASNEEGPKNMKKAFGLKV